MYEDVNARNRAINNSNKLFNNYSAAKDNTMSNLETSMREDARWIKDNIFDYMPSGLSNCTLNTTHWIDPSNVYMRASSIVNGDAKNFLPIKAEDAIPGDVLIVNNPDTGSYHTMFITGYRNGLPLLTYSSGGGNSESLKRNISYNKYHRLDKKLGGNHTVDLYYRPLYPNEITLPEATITPNTDGITNYLDYVNE